MNSPWFALVALALFILATGAGSFIGPRLSARHKNRETIEFLQVTVTMLVTFAAIVLGLLITSAKDGFDKANADLRSYSTALVQLDLLLRDVGPAAAPARQNLTRYTAAAIASTWASEAPPPGAYYPPRVPATSTDLLEESSALGGLLNAVGKDIRGLPAATPDERHAREACLAQMDRLVQQRWALISASQGTLSAPFFIVLVFWLVIIFLCFGLSTPLNPLSAVMIALSAIALASALFVVIDLNTLFDSDFFAISSKPMRDALAHMLRA